MATAHISIKFSCTADSDELVSDCKEQLTCFSIDLVQVFSAQGHEVGLFTAMADAAKT